MGGGSHDDNKRQRSGAGTTTRGRIEFKGEKEEVGKGGHKAIVAKGRQGQASARTEVE